MVAEKIFEANGVTTEILRPVDYELAAGPGKNMADTDEWDRDDWPQLQAKG